MLRIVIILSFICWLDLLSAHPTDEPTKFILNNMQSDAENILPSRLEDAKVKFCACNNKIRFAKICENAIFEKQNCRKRTARVQVIFFLPTSEAIKQRNLN